MHPSHDSESSFLLNSRPCRLARDSGAGFSYSLTGIEKKNDSKLVSYRQKQMKKTTLSKKKKSRIQNKISKIIITCKNILLYIYVCM